MIRRFRLLGNALTAGSSPVVRRASSSNSILFSDLFRLHSAADHIPTSYASLISGFSSCFTGDKSLPRYCDSAHITIRLRAFLFAYTFVLCPLSN